MKQEICTIYYNWAYIILYNYYYFISVVDLADSIHNIIMDISAIGYYAN